METTTLSSSQVPGNSPSKVNQTEVTYLDLSDKGLKNLSSLSLSMFNLRTLVHLDLSFNRLEDLQVLPQECSKLVHLNLRRNVLTKLPYDFCQLTSLTYLDLSHNHFSKLPDDFLVNLKSLTHLDLGWNLLVKCPMGLENLTDLTYLDLSHNRLFDSPPDFPNRLTHLKMGSNRFSSFPVLQMDQLQNLISLDLSFQELNFLPSEIGSLASLRDLNLASTHLSHLPLEIGNLRDLTVLNISLNQLTSLPESFSCLTQLTHLDISFNKFSELPFDPIHFQNLLELDLRRNLIVSLPDQFGSLTRLTKLNLSSNQLQHLPGNFVQLRNLISLDVSSNFLIELPLGFGQLTQLTSLNLYSGQLTSFPSDFVQLVSLEKLNCQKNHLTSLLALGQCPRLREIHYDQEKIPLNERPRRVLAGQMVREVRSQTEFVPEKSIHFSMEKSLENLLFDPYLLSASELFDLIWKDKILSSSAKRMILSYIDLEYDLQDWFGQKEFSVSKFFGLVWQRITNHPDSQELKRILETELDDEPDTCLSGFLLKSLNVLSGFYDDIGIQVSEEEHICQIISSLISKIGSGNSLQKEVRKRLEELELQEEEIRFWLDFLP